MAEHLLHIAIVAGVLMIIAGCDRPSGETRQAPPATSAAALTKAPEITAESEEGFVDLVFYIAEPRSGDGRAALACTPDVVSMNRLSFGCSLRF